MKTAEGTVETGRLDDEGNLYVDDAEKQIYGAGDYTRGYISAGHAADAPGNPAGLHAAPVPHIDLTASRGHLTRISPTAPMGPGGYQ